VCVGHVMTTTVHTALTKADLWQRVNMVESPWLTAPERPRRIGAVLFSSIRSR
jgi:hypothetical protein